MLTRASMLLAATLFGCSGVGDIDDAMNEPCASDCVDGDGDGTGDGVGARASFRKSFAGGVDRWTDLAVGADDSFCATFSLSQSVDFGGGALVPDGDTRLGVACFDAAGAHRWSRVYPLRSSYDNIAIDGDGNVVLAVAGEEAIDFGGGALAATSASSLVLAKLTATGDQVWALRFGDDSSLGPRGVAIDREDNVYVTGTFSGSIDLGEGPQSAATPGFSDMFVAKFLPDGSVGWYVAHGAPQTTTPVSVGVSDVGGETKVTVVGTCLQPDGGLDFGDGAQPAHAATMGFVATFDARGDIEWSTLEEGSMSRGGFFDAAAVGKDGKVFVSARYGVPGGVTSYRFDYDNRGNAMGAEEEESAMGGDVAVRARSGEVAHVRMTNMASGGTVRVKYELERTPRTGSATRTSYGESTLVNGALPAARLERVATSPETNALLVAGGDDAGSFIERLE